MVTFLFFFFPSQLLPPTQHPQLVQRTEGAVGTGWRPVGYKEASSELEVASTESDTHLCTCPQILGKLQ